MIEDGDEGPKREELAVRILGVFIAFHMMVFPLGVASALAQARSGDYGPPARALRPRASGWARDRPTLHHRAHELGISGRRIVRACADEVDAMERGDSRTLDAHRMSQDPTSFGMGRFRHRRHDGLVYEDGGLLPVHG